MVISVLKLKQKNIKMNERIQELAEQAKCYADENSAHYLQNPHWIETFEQKFAELIVRECVRYFNEDYQRDFDTLWREDLTKGIKEHFGVEE